MKTAAIAFAAFALGVNYGQAKYIRRLNKAHETTALILDFLVWLNNTLADDNFDPHSFSKVYNEKLEFLNIALKA